MQKLFVKVEFLCFCVTSSKAIVPNKDIVKRVLAIVDHPQLFIPIELIDSYEFNSSLFSDSDCNSAVRYGFLFLKIELVIGYLVRMKKF